MIGSGVIGMTTALCLADAGHPVTVVTAHPPNATTSAVAGALWGPYAVDDDRVVRWSLATLNLVRDLPGVHLVRGREASRVDMAPPPWLPGLADFAMMAPPDGFVTGWAYSAPIFEMPVYLAFLGRRLLEAGVRTEILARPLRSLREVAREADVVVNCTGLGARDLVPDPEMSASWGLLVRVENPGIGMGFFSDYPEVDEPTYYIAHADHVILGGCLFPGPDDHAAARIVERCAAVDPRLSAARVTGTQAGLRPLRPTIRLERTALDDTVIIHNYGHGGSGVTLSWGCALDVADILG